MLPSQLGKQDMFGAGSPQTLTPLIPLFYMSQHKENIALGQLSVGEGLLEINNTRQPYVKVPISNHSKHEITLPKRSALGTIQHIAKVLETDAPGSLQPDFMPSKTAAEVNITSPNIPSPEPCLLHVNISHLNPEQQQAVEKVLYEESGAFSHHCGDIGCILSLQMGIRLRDDTPVQRAYASIPKPLYREVKEYIQEMLVKG